MKLGLGTVQFGLDYGISNAGGRTPQDEVVAILDAARRHGVSVVDTAAAYGCSEQVLGAAGVGDGPFRVVTKTLPVRREQVGAADAAALRARFLASLEQLRLSQAYGLMVHHCDDLFAPGGALLWEAMCRLREEGRVSRLGASVYGGAQIERLLAQYPVDIVQVPVNVFDQRLLAGGQLRRLKAAGVEVHARSVFLQGLLLMEPQQLPAHFDPIRRHVAAYRACVDRAGVSPQAAAYHFVAGLPEIDTVVCGVNDRRQFEELCRIAGQPLELDLAGFGLNDERYVDPSRWPS